MVKGLVFQLFQQFYNIFSFVVLVTIYLGDVKIMGKEKFERLESGDDEVNN